MTDESSEEEAPEEEQEEENQEEDSSETGEEQDKDNSEKKEKKEKGEWGEIDEVPEEYESKKYEFNSDDYDELYYRVLGEMRAESREKVRGELEKRIQESENVEKVLREVEESADERAREYINEYWSKTKQMVEGLKGELKVSAGQKVKNLARLCYSLLVNASDQIIGESIVQARNEAVMKSLKKGDKVIIWHNGHWQKAGNARALQKQALKRGIKMYVQTYDWQNDIDTLSGNLAETIRTVYEKTGRLVSVGGHSRGGLAIKHLLATQDMAKSDAGRMIGKYVFSQSPFGENPGELLGHYAVQLAGSIPDEVNVKTKKGLRLSYAMQITDTRAPTDNLVGTGSNGRDDGLVPVYTAIDKFADAQGRTTLVPANHFDASGLNDRYNAAVLDCFEKKWKGAEFLRYVRPTVMRKTA